MSQIRVYNPYNNTNYLAPTREAAEILRREFENPFQVESQSVGRGGLGGELDKAGNILNVLGAGIGSILGGGGGTDAMSEASMYQGGPETSYIGADALQSLLGDQSLNVDAVNRFTGERLTREGQQQSMGFLDDIAGGIMSPISNVLSGAVQTGTNLAGQALGMDTSDLNFYVSPERQEEYLSSPLGFGKDLVGAGAFFVPVGRGVSGLARAGAVSGGMTGASQVDLDALQQGQFGDALGQIATGAVTGGATGGALGIAGRGLGSVAQRFGSRASDDIATIGNRSFIDKLDDAAQARELNAFRRSVGGSAPQSGTKGSLKGAALERKAYDLSQEFGIPVKSADDLANLRDTVLNTFQGQQDEIASQLTQQGTRFSKQEIVNPLTRQLDEMTSRGVIKPEIKRNLQKVIDDISESITTTDVSPAQALELKRQLGRTMSNAIGDQKTARQLERLVYSNINDLIESAGTKAGLGSIKNINKNIEAGIRMDDWLERMGRVDRPGNTLTDMFQDAIGLGGAAGGAAGGIVGGPVGALAGYGLSRYAASPAGERMVARGLRGMANAGRRVASISDSVPGGIMPNMTGLQGLINMAPTNAARMAAGTVVPVSLAQIATQSGGQYQAGEDQVPLDQSQMQLPGSTQLGAQQPGLAGLPQQQQVFDTRAFARDLVMSRQMTDPFEAMEYAEGIGVLMGNQPDMALGGMGFGGGNMPMPGASKQEIAQMYLAQGDSPDQALKKAESMMEIQGNSTLSRGIDELERLYGVGTDRSLSAGGSTAGIGGLLTRAGVEARKAADQGFNDRMAAYSQMRSVVMGLINEARGAGTLNEGEAQQMIADMPNEYTSESAAKSYFDNIRRLLV